jgi:hypothetical protein
LDDADALVAPKAPLNGEAPLLLGVESDLGVVLEAEPGFHCVNGVDVPSFSTFDVLEDDFVFIVVDDPGFHPPKGGDEVELDKFCSEDNPEDGLVFPVLDDPGDQPPNGEEAAEVDAFWSPFGDALKGEDDDFPKDETNPGGVF